MIPLVTPAKPEENEHSFQGAAHSAAVSASPALSDPQLLLLINSWDQIPDEIKAGILAMLQAIGISSEPIEKN